MDFSVGHEDWWECGVHCHIVEPVQLHSSSLCTICSQTGRLSWISIVLNLVPLWCSYYMIFLSIPWCYPSTLFSVSPRPLLPFIPPSISNRCTPFPLIICPKYWHFLFFDSILIMTFWFFILCKLLHLVCVLSTIFLTFSCIATFQKPVICRMLL